MASFSWRDRKVRSSLLVILASLASLLPLLWFMEDRVDVSKPHGVNHWWLVFGFGAQMLFAGRLVVQWIATERSRKSVVPPAFWWLSLIGGFMLLVYFWRRGDPVGIAGQLFGNVVYIRNLYFLYCDRTAACGDAEEAEAAAAAAAASPTPPAPAPAVAAAAALPAPTSALPGGIGAAPGPVSARRGRAAVRRQSRQRQ